MIFINGHEILLDQNKRLEPWATYDRVLFLAMDFIKHCPIEPHNGLPWYLQYSCFWTDPLRPANWPDNPAGKFAWATTTLLKYYPYSGDASFIEIVRSMLDRLWEYRTPDSCAWGGVPYASAHPGTGVYFGARADGEYATEADKVAQAGKAFLDFYEISGDKEFLERGRHCANVLLEKMRPGDEAHSPWPFRMDVRDGSAIEEYTSHMIPAVRLFEELVRLGYMEFEAPRAAVWEWLQTYPLKNMIWKGHFEDIRLDPTNGNRDQLSPLETARYILEHKEEIQGWRPVVKGLIDWVEETLGDHPFFTAIPIHEQKYCYFPMGSHTARFASLCALYAAASGDGAYREKAIRSFNWATYMANEDGWVVCGVDPPDYYNQCWFTDGYFDYVPHFLDGMAAFPELAPGDSDHMLSSSSAVQEIHYEPFRIKYKVFRSEGEQKLRLTFRPRQVLSGDKPLNEIAAGSIGPGWYMDPENGVVVVHPGNCEVMINGR